ncbi:hypothetical protein [Bifidobacterium vansinderenii]|uniref:Uncharacterized protein n=1 Tax=Bifidobacterium vansinderenii TaxID=1984871 RepID=A0A229W010_9BIFI|nr:hypothetical protein [Bifidobacterium vansinderenii]OXN01182.1 hypothetical protein Tam10B_0580 [Bifidobacterium vansinderenii]
MSHVGIVAGDRAGRRNAIADPTDVVLYLALLLLPAGGTVFGFTMMYWSPISPILFAVYVLLNIRLIPRVFFRYAAIMVFPVALVAVSVFGWLSVGFHAHTAMQTIVALVTGLSCLVALDIAFRIKRLDWNFAVTAIVVAYGVSFGIGVLEFFAVHGHASFVVTLAERTLERNYVHVPGRVQFLFAEPSYIGMHLFGVLMPLYWLTRRRDLPILILIYAFGSAAMGAGVRILIDTVIALVLWLIVVVDFHKVRNMVIAAVGVVVVGIGGGIVMLSNDRVQSLIANGPVSGDFSATARIFRTLAPVEAWIADPVHMMFGFGIGNLKDAIARGYDAAWRQLVAMGGAPQDNGEIRLLGTPPGDHYIFTMNAYVDFITEFGLVMFIAALALVFVHVTRNHAWNKMSVCWLLLLAYLYIQFEGYAFYAFWLFIWAVGASVLPKAAVRERKEREGCDRRHAEEERG